MTFYKNQAVFTVYRWFWGVKWRKLDGFCNFSPINGTNSKVIIYEIMISDQNPKIGKTAKNDNIFPRLT